MNYRAPTRTDPQIKPEKSKLKQFVDNLKEIAKAIWNVLVIFIGLPVFLYETITGRLVSNLKEISNKIPSSIIYLLFSYFSPLCLLCTVGIMFGVTSSIGITLGIGLGVGLDCAQTRDNPITNQANITNQTNITSAAVARFL